jgi:hypothetical protein
MFLRKMQPVVLPSELKRKMAAVLLIQHNNHKQEKTHITEVRCASINSKTRARCYGNMATAVITQGRSDD